MKLSIWLSNLYWAVKYEMKSINTQGITRFELLNGSCEWYWGTDYIHGDLYEAEELFKMVHKIKSNKLLFIHYPDGSVVEPVKPQDGQYFGCPIYCDNYIVILLVDFLNKQIKLVQYDDKSNETTLLTVIPLGNAKDCYNLLLKKCPLMLTRQGNEGKFEMIYPEKMEFEITPNESFYFRENDKLFFSAWYEDPDYREEVIVREIFTGRISDKISGAIQFMPDGQKWILG